MSRFLLLGFIAIGVFSTEACTYLGKQYAMGEVWTASDGCNQCVCGIVGSICTKKICVDTPPVTPPPDAAPTTESAPKAASCLVVGTDGTQMTYKDGDSFPSPDGCNTCACRNGISLCTLMACIKLPECTDASTGRTYRVGESFPSADGCNTCQCYDGGISCTKQLCSTPKQNVCTDSQGVIRKDGDTFQAADGCNTCTCSNGMAACTEMACMNVGQCFDRFTLQLHDNGENFEAPDGCNKCNCRDGVITCTKNIC